MRNRPSRITDCRFPAVIYDFPSSLFLPIVLPIFHECFASNFAFIAARPEEESWRMRDNEEGEGRGGGITRSGVEKLITARSFQVNSEILLFPGSYRKEGGFGFENLK